MLAWLARLAWFAMFVSPTSATSARLSRWGKENDTQLFVVSKLTCCVLLAGLLTKLQVQLMRGCVHCAVCSHQGYMWDGFLNECVHCCVDVHNNKIKFKVIKQIGLVSG